MAPILGQGRAPTLKSRSPRPKGQRVVAVVVVVVTFFNHNFVNWSLPTWWGVWGALYKLPQRGPGWSRYKVFLHSTMIPVFQRRQTCWGHIYIYSP